MRRDGDRRPGARAAPSLAACAQPPGPARLAGRALAVGALGLLAANCAAGPTAQRAASSGGLDPKYGVAASPRVVAEGDPVPKGGGRYQVGRSYKVAGRTYTPRENPEYAAVGLASWYGAAFHGRLTANGEVFDRHSIAAAHPTMPLPSYARVTNLSNKRSIVVRVNDRGPYHANRVLDVSERAAAALDFRRAGTARVKVDYVGRAGLAGSDDRRLLASLRLDGSPAEVANDGRAVLVAAASPRPAPLREVARAADLAPDGGAAPEGGAPARAASEPPVLLAATGAAPLPTAAPRAQVASLLPPREAGPARDETAAAGARAAPGVPLPPARPAFEEVAEADDDPAPEAVARPAASRPSPVVPLPPRPPHRRLAGLGEEG